MIRRLFIAILGSFQKCTNKFKGDAKFFLLVAHKMVSQNKTPGLEK